MVCLFPFIAFPMVVLLPDVIFLIKALNQSHFCPHLLPGRLRFGITRALQQASGDVNVFRPVEDLSYGQRVNRLKLANCVCSELRQLKYRFGFW